MTGVAPQLRSALAGISGVLVTPFDTAAIARTGRGLAAAVRLSRPTVVSPHLGGREAARR